MTLSDGFGTSRDSCGPDCCMQVVRPGTIKCDLCDGNPNVRRLEARVKELEMGLKDCSIKMLELVLGEKKTAFPTSGEMLEHS
jgi:hypothetical protein